MKKWIPVIGTGALALGLAACGQETESGMTVEEVFAQSTEAAAEIESLHADMVIEQTMASEAEGMDVTTDMDMSMDMVMEPLAMHQEGTVTIKAPDMPEMPMETEMYLTSEGIYVHDAMSGGWTKMPAEELEMLQASIDQQAADPAEQLEQLEPFKDDFTFEETEDAYILTLDASGEEFQELLDQEMEKMAEQLGTEAAAMGNMEIGSVQYEVLIDKETFMTDSLAMTMDFSVAAEGGTTNVTQTIQSEFSQFNEIGEITVPQEVKDTATEL
ncbi:DUF6612 family protein [Indiicoccus explosivorum]|uniref:DUF6612 family protein n=1 Tax=Indiicoccus explosivorum TaxID=1917864 RepID=UPI000B43264F|nr:DUF6612 family protein [Indiicoccus explosivorum]